MVAISMLGHTALVLLLLAASRLQITVYGVAGLFMGALCMAALSLMIVNGFKKEFLLGKALRAAVKSGCSAGGQGGSIPWNRAVRCSAGAGAVWRACAVQLCVCGGHQHPGGNFVFGDTHAGSGPPGSGRGTWRKPHLFWRQKGGGIMQRHSKILRGQLLQ